MALMIVRYDVGAGPQWAVLQGAAPQRPEDLVEAAALETAATTLGDLIAELDRGGVAASSGQVARFSARAILSPVTADATLICQGLNYKDHAAEAGHHQRKANLLFTKASSSLSGPYDDIIRPGDVELLDYEVEVGIILRRELLSGTAVVENDIGDFVAGVVLCNDVSARDTMFGASFFQWFRGKSYRSFCPAGPVFYYLGADEVAAALDNLDISLTCRGEVKQSANTSQLIYKPAETLHEIAGLMDLKRGDMVLTGTPGGVIAQGTPGLIEILKTRLLDDHMRRAEMREEMKKLGSFLQPGEKVALTLRDSARGVDLGGQYSQIADAS